MHQRADSVRTVSLRLVNEDVIPLDRDEKELDLNSSALPNQNGAFRKHGRTLKITPPLFSFFLHFFFSLPLPSVRLCGQMAGLQVGRKIYTINEDLLFLRPFSEVETMISQAFCIRRSLRLLVATKAKE